MSHQQAEDTPVKNDCPTCRIIRNFLFLAAPMILILAINNNQPEAEAFALTVPLGVDLIDVVSYGSLLLLCVAVAYRYYQEFYKPKQDKKTRRALADDAQRADDDGTQ
jgi:hypothetical protein